MDLKVFPNPSRTGKFIVASTDQDLTIAIRNMQGNVINKQIVLANKPTEIELDEPSGLFVLEIFNGKQTSFKKIIVQK
jgi:hypothetical protein